MVSAYAGYSPVRTSRGAPRIVANRRQIDNRFPVLGFSVYAGDGRWFEVWLATQASLLQPANASQRNAGNFYSSRDDSGPIQSSGTSSVYMVPASVLGSFTQVSPRPTAIYFNLVTYANEEGTGAVYAYPPGTPLSAIPYVHMSPDFHGDTLTSQSLSFGRLQRVGARPVRSLDQDAASDRGEGEDGFSDPLLNIGTPPPAQPLATRAWSLNDLPLSPVTGPQDGYELYQQPSEPSNVAPPANGSAPAVASAYNAGLEYSDGYETQDQPYGNAYSNGSTNVATSSAMSYGDAADIGDADPYDTRDEEFSYERYAAAQTSHSPPRAAEPAALEGDGDFYDDGYGDNAAPASAGHQWDDEVDLAYDSLDGYPQAASAVAFSTPPTAMTIDEKLKIIEKVAQFESSRDGYSAINADGEFRGVFNIGGTVHPAYQKWHVGLSYGVIQFTQDSGVLGKLLAMMRDRDAAKFSEVFGPDADELVRVTSIESEPSRRFPEGRSPRVQPVAGADIWEEPWVSRFKAAGQHRPFQAAQNELAARTFIDPMLPFAHWLGLNTDRALVTVVDRAVQMGGGGARQWIMQAVGPVTTTAQRQAALTALGHADVTSFQRATPGLDDDGDFGPWTHAAMVNALRALGTQSPVSIMTREQMLDAMVRHANGRRWAHRVEKLRSSSEFTDVEYDLAPVTPH